MSLPREDSIGFDEGFGFLFNNVPIAGEFDSDRRAFQPKAS